MIVKRTRRLPMLGLALALSTSGCVFTAGPTTMPGGGVAHETNVEAGKEGLVIIGVVVLATVGIVWLALKWADSFKNIS
jgi:hypothetical protein